MQIHIKNIGIIKKAKIHVDGITVITGENDSGKSTVGKILYSTLNILSRFQEEKTENQNKFISKRLQKVLQSLEFEKDIYNETENYMLFRSDFKRNELINIRDRISNEINNSSESYKKSILKYFDEIDEIYSNEKQQCFAKKLFATNLCNEFDGQIHNLEEKDNAIIKIIENDRDVLSINFEINQIRELEIKKYSFFENVFFIDTPFIIDDLNKMIKFFPQSEKILDNKKYDLIEKLRSNCDLDIFSKEAYLNRIKVINKKLSEIVSGEFELDNNGLGYIRSGKRIHTNTMAAGLKIYSIIKILLDNYWLNSSSLFIFDEPEIHLHPHWQIVLAELFAQLSQELNVHILVNTHSPYFLRALQIYTKKYAIEDNAHYYFAQKIDEFRSEIKNIDDDLGMTYATLSKPFEDLEEISKIYM